MQVITPRQMQLGLNSPLELPNLAAWYDLSRPASTTSDYIRIDASNRCSLVADTSGNSAVNGLVLPGVNGNYASALDSVALSITGDIDIRVSAQLPSWATGSTFALLSKQASAAARSYRLEVKTTGALALSFSIDGTTAITADSTSATSFAAYSANWVRVTRASATGSVNFYTSADGMSWTQLGTTVASTAGSIADTAALLEIGTTFGGTASLATGIFYHALVYDTIGSATNTGAIGSLSPAFWANFTTAAKLATSFTESSSNAATVTINTSGATGARISGARDAYQGTAANQPIYSIASSKALATFDGSNDYLKSASYSASQPMTRYTVFKHVTWTIGDILWDGNAAGSAKTSQAGTTPNLQLNAGSGGPQLSTFVLNTWAVTVEVINGASSLMQRNLGSPNTADAGAGNPLGTTIGADGAGANAANITLSERLSYGAAHDAATRARVVNYLLQKWTVTP